MTTIKRLNDESGEEFYPRTVKAAIADYDAPSITVTNTDPGEGAPLADGSFIAVYGEDGQLTLDDINLRGRIETGIATISMSSGSTYSTKNVSFSSAFSNAPKVLLTLLDSGNTMSVIRLNSVPATTGFTAKAVRSSSSGSATYTFHWLAIDI